MSTQLVCNIECAAESRLGDKVLIRFSLTNSGKETVWVLNWNTPLEDVCSQFVITRDNTRLRYVGVLRTPVRASAEDYIQISPGKTITSTIDLARSYPLNKPGKYQVRLDLFIQDCVTSATETARSIDEQDYVFVRSAPVEFSINAGRESAATVVRPTDRVEKPRSSTQRKPGVIPPAVVPVITGGTADQQNVVLSAHAGAYSRILAALKHLATNNSGDQVYVTWFGAYDAERFSTVVVNYQRMANTISEVVYTYDCTGPDCKKDWAAYTTLGSTTIYLCKLFWGLEPCADLSQDTTAVHEFSHSAALTADNIYGVKNCKKLAKEHPDQAINNAENYGFFSNYVPTISWGDAVKYHTGGDLAVAVNNKGNVVEVHRGVEHGNNHYYLVGILDANNKRIDWGKSTKYDTGSIVALAMDDSGNVVEVHCGASHPTDHYYMVGTVDAANLKIQWGKSHKFDKGRTITVAMDNDLNVVEVHDTDSPWNDDHFCTVGKLDPTNQTISWGKSQKYDRGARLAVALDNSGNVIEVHLATPSRHFYLVGTMDAANQQITWGPARKYDDGTTLAVATDNNGNIVEVHCGYNHDTDHYYLVGIRNNAWIDWTPLYTIALRKAVKYDTGSFLAVAMDDNGNIVEVHCGANHPNDHYYVVGQLLLLD